MTIKVYRIPYTIIGILILEYQGKFYSFGATVRSAKSIWEEVKEKLESLITVDYTEAEIEEVKQYFVEEFKEN